mmetsp:Transcript_48770/g.80935  ORF Transcript_48770/g.80935 Transcript_48770/m.80935 type:complete len:305 (-) Transcript_48770:1054-1968(-)
MHVIAKRDTVAATRSVIVVRFIGVCAIAEGVGVGARQCRRRRNGGGRRGAGTLQLQLQLLILVDALLGKHLLQLLLLLLLALVIAIQVIHLLAGRLKRAHTHFAYSAFGHRRHKRFARAFVDRFRGINPSVLQDVVDAHSFARIALQQPQHQPLAVLAHVTPILVVHHHFLVDDRVRHIQLSLAPKRRISAQQNEGNHAQRPIIDALVVRSFFEDLGRRVTDRAAHRLHQVLVLVLVLEKRVAHALLFAAAAAMSAMRSWMLLLRQRVNEFLLLLAAAAAARFMPTTHTGTRWRTRRRRHRRRR